MKDIRLKGEALLGQALLGGALLGGALLGAALLGGALLGGALLGEALLDEALQNVVAQGALESRHGVDPHPEEAGASRGNAAEAETEGGEAGVPAVEGTDVDEM
jgi:hypothetical protein